MLALVYGTRPEAVKIGPVVAQLRTLGVPHHLICTNQHTTLLDVTKAGEDLAFAQNLGLASDGTVTQWMHRAVPILQQAYWDAGVSVVVVQGDTMSACAGARAARFNKLTLCHIEAGVRSGDLNNPFPEESLRREITSLTDVHYAATETAMENLRREGVHPENVLLTGNPVVSALERYTPARHVEEPEPHILITLHRRETVQRNPWILDIVQALVDAVAFIDPVKVYWPAHPTLRDAIASAHDVPDNLILSGPMAYLPFTKLLASSLGVLTDSGGVQEEAATLGVPCAVFREVTDRPESVEAGVAKLFKPTPQNTLNALECLVERGLPRRPLPIYGSPNAAARIAAHLSRLVKNLEAAA